MLGRLFQRGAGLVRFLLQQREQPETFFISTRWFLSALGLIYCVAFGSLWTQIRGLLGPRGILPVGDYLAALSAQVGPSRFWLVPTFSWWEPERGLLQTQCVAGLGFGLLLSLGVVPRLAALGVWALYLSLSSVGQEFLSYQWDTLLLETGFLAVCLAPPVWGSARAKARAPRGPALWLLRLLLFKLMFSSGVVKLLSGDPSWRHLTALTFHYETQPLPTWIGWYAHQLPAWFQIAAAAVMFVVELAVPWLIFAPRRLPLLAAGAFASLMVLISLTGNYCFFNLLTVVLCLPLVGDSVWERLLPPTYRPVPPPPAPEAPWRPVLRGAVVGTLFLLSGLNMVFRWLPAGSLPTPAVRLLQAVAPLRTFNAYGLFASMTRPRDEIVVEGSNNGEDWAPYEFKWKAGRLDRRPGFVAPYQPRLDWQMWFAALGNVDQHPWFLNLLSRLLQGSPDVLFLLDKNPFPRAPPRYVRAVLYEYHFTTFAQRRATGNWWRRERIGLYCPRLSLRPIPPPTPSKQTRT